MGWFCTGVVGRREGLRGTGGEEVLEVGRVEGRGRLPEEGFVGVLQVKAGKGIGKDHEDFDEVLRGFLVFERGKRVRGHDREQCGPQGVLRGRGVG